MSQRVMATSRRDPDLLDVPATRTTLYRSDSLSVVDIACRVHPHPLGPEEAAAPPSLGELARSLECSPFHLSRIFSRTVGVPLRRYLDRLRLRLALEQLGAAETNLTDLALDLGYADHSHFTNAFRREFGLAPSELRRHSRPTRAVTARKNIQA